MPEHNDPRAAIFQDGMSKLNPDLPGAQGHAACLRADTHRQAQSGMLYRRSSTSSKRATGHSRARKSRSPRRPRREAYDDKN
jgi:hypothetical protein